MAYVDDPAPLPTPALAILSEYPGAERPRSLQEIQGSTKQIVYVRSVDQSWVFEDWQQAIAFSNSVNAKIYIIKE